MKPVYTFKLNKETVSIYSDRLLKLLHTSNLPHDMQVIASCVLTAVRAIRDYNLINKEEWTKLCDWCWEIYSLKYEDETKIVVDSETKLH